MTEVTDSPDDAATPPAAPPKESEPARWFGLRNPFAVGFYAVLGGLVALALGIAVTNIVTVIVYIAFALFVALGLDPVVRALERKNVSRVWSIVIVYFGFAIVLAGVLLLILPTVVEQIAQFITDIPTLINNFMQSDVFLWAEDNFGDSLGDILGEVESFVTNPSNIAAIGGGVLQAGISLATGISGAIIVIVLSLYFLASLPTMKQAFYRLAPARNRAGIADLTEQITDSVGGYLMGMVILAFFNATFTFIMYLILGLPFPALLAVTSFCITIIPLVGPVLFWIIGSTVALFADPLLALIFAAAYLVYMQIEAYVLTPRVMNRTISIPGSLVVIGALVGGTLLGLLGALVAIPVTASILLIIKQVLIPRQDAKV
ncbi:MAG: AI-2E family transporter [Microbacterium sp.]|uniref:AI-2E family transporter n=1 Tax=unclassified Microbacterium TaxID=2609290 RepID=UPI00096A9DC2|nr:MULTISPECIES: AI-2E family transporter [unclassified Microbacterium]MAY49781.1 AI-2E family transporter [Microbacterium sp.]HBR90326.1 AI-2E family transporter [Microbacterium sp.]|tara:strand:+ start:11596 stop:12720 length:1125 start_codon:yes stop_codon:yes gene_type:complete